MTKEWAIKLACAAYDYRWPRHLSSGVMFYEGFRITIQEFNECKELFGEK